MKKVIGIMKDMVRVVCVCVMFPGVDFDPDYLSVYFSSEGKK